MIKELLYKLYTDHRQFAGDGAVMVMFIASILALILLYRKKEKSPGAVFLSPLAAIAVAAAAICEEAVSRFTKRSHRCGAGLVAVFLCILAVVSSGTNVFSEELSERAENNMHIPTGIMEAMDVTLSDTDEPRIAVMPGWGQYFEGYSSRFGLMYEEPDGDDISSFNDDQRIVYTELSDVHPDMGKVASAARRAGCRYVIISRDVWPKVAINGHGYKLMFENDRCLVYREVDAP